MKALDQFLGEGGDDASIVGGGGGRDPSVYRRKHSALTFRRARSRGGRPEAFEQRRRRRGFARTPRCAPIVSPLGRRVCPAADRAGHLRVMCVRLLARSRGCLREASRAPCPFLRLLRSQGHVCMCTRAQFMHVIEYAAPLRRRSEQGEMSTTVAAKAVVLRSRQPCDTVTIAALHCQTGLCRYHMPIHRA